MFQIEQVLHALMYPLLILAETTESRGAWGCLYGVLIDAPSMRLLEMSDAEIRIVSASREIRAGSDRIFELIADPARQPEWDGNDNLADAASGQRVHGVGDVFTMTLTWGAVRENHVVEFADGRLIAWKPAEPGKPPVGHLWRWQVDPIDDERSVVVHTYDWTELDDETRLERARATTSDRLAVSLDRLATLAENDPRGSDD